MVDEIASTLSTGQLFHGRYEVVGRLGAGGMGAVYEVLDRATRRRRALKVMLANLAADASLRARFEFEARVTADVESEHIVQTFDAGLDAETGSPFLVMELLRGKDVGTLLEERGCLTSHETIELLRQAAMALDRTHAAGIIHRDLKPENLFVTQRDDGAAWLKILDFGIAKLVAQTGQSYQTTHCVGTPAYMSPEQIRGDGAIGAPADVYALAHIAYTMLVGESYWAPEARSSAGLYPLLIKMAQGMAEPASARAVARGVRLPAGFDMWFARATAPSPAARFPSAGLLVRELASRLGAVAAPSAAGWSPGHATVAAPEPPSAFPVTHPPAMPTASLALGSRRAPAPTATGLTTTLPRSASAGPTIAKRMAYIALAVVVLAGGGWAAFALRPNFESRGGAVTASSPPSAVSVAMPLTASAVASIEEGPITAPAPSAAEPVAALSALSASRASADLPTRPSHGPPSVNHPGPRLQPRRPTPAASAEDPTDIR